MIPPTDDPDDTALEELLAPEHATPRAGALAPSPYSFAFSGEDSLRLTVHNSVLGVTISVNYRVFSAAAITQAARYTFRPSADRLASVTEFTIGTGYLLNVSVFASSGEPRTGQTFARLQVIRGRGAAATVLGTIVQGYLTAEQDLGWPGSPIESSLASGGTFRTIFGTRPALGQLASETVPEGARWALLSLATQVETSPAPTPRIPNLTIVYGGRFMWWSSPPGTVGASVEKFYSWVHGLALENEVNPYAQLAGLPVQTELLAGTIITVGVASPDAGDQWAAPVLNVREWLEAK